MNKKRMVLSFTVILIMVIMVFVSNRALWQYGNLDLDEGWYFLPGEYFSPMERTPTDLEMISLKDISGSVLGTSDRLRGTFFKTVQIPRSWVGSELMLYNVAFNDNAKFYINGELIVTQGSFTTMGNDNLISGISDIIRVDGSGRDIEIRILYDGYRSHIVGTDGIFILPQDDMVKRLRFIDGLQMTGLAFSILLLWMVSQKRIGKGLKQQEVTFVILVILRWLTLSITPFGKYLSMSYSLWNRTGCAIQILLICYALLILFNKEIIWRKRFNVGLSVLTYILVLTLLLFETINPHLILLVYALVVVGIYMIYRKKIYGGELFIEMIIVNACLILDVVERFYHFYIPIPMLIITGYGILWHYQYEQKRLPLFVKNDEHGEAALPALAEEAHSINTVCREILEMSGIIAVSVATTAIEMTPSAEALLGEVSTYEQLGSLIFSNDVEQAYYFKEILNRMLSHLSVEEKKVYLDLLPKSAMLKGSYYEVKSRWSEKQHTLIFELIDCSQARKDALETEKMKREMETSIEILKDKHTFIRLMSDYHQFTQILSDQLKGDHVDVLSICDFVIYKLNHFMISLQHFKMTAGVERMVRIVTELELLQEHHRIEELLQLREVLDSYELSTLLDDVFDEVKGYVELDEDSEHLRTISVIQLRVLSDLIDELPESELKGKLKAQLWRTQHLRFKHLIAEYDGYIQDLARANGKKMKRIEVAGDDIYIDHERLEYFSKGCFTIIDNAVIHGIEFPNERLRKGKSELGTLKVLLEGSHDFVGITITDDGRGFDIEGIKKHLMQNTSDDIQKQIREMSDSELIESLLSGCFHKDGGHITGLTLLYNEIESLKGSLTITTKQDVGVTISIRIKNEKAYVF